MPETWNVNSEDLAGDVRTWAAYLLGRNEYGIWLYTATGTPIHSATGEQTDTLQAQAQLIPHDKPWVASWYQDGSAIADVTTPPEVNARSIRYVDLGLRTWTREGEGAVRSETDAYDNAVATGLVTAGRDVAARKAFSDLERQMAERVEPFGLVGRRWFTGITRNELHFMAYDPQWPAKFTAARDEMLPLLPPSSRVEHFGSTAVPGLAAKDCIDIAVVVPRQEQFSQAIIALDALGYEGRADDDPGHVFLRRITSGRRSHHLHLYYEGHQNLIEVLAFRDLLRADPSARERYQRVKQSLAEANPYDRSGYLAGKNEVIRELLDVALARPR